jgi:hypothetical protein
VLCRVTEVLKAGNSICVRITDCASLSSKYGVKQFMDDTKARSFRSLSHGANGRSFLDTRNGLDHNTSREIYPRQRRKQAVALSARGDCEVRDSYSKPSYSTSIFLDAPTCNLLNHSKQGPCHHYAYSASTSNASLGKASFQSPKPTLSFRSATWCRTYVCTP